jgi:hypothetical protein
LYVFSEPSAGWSSGHQTAKLKLPDGTFPAIDTAQGRTAAVGGMISGRTVAATGTAYVFTEPTTAWTGPVTPAALLTPGYAPQRPEAYLCTEPSRGWSGIIYPSARLMPTELDPGDVITDVAISANTVAVTGYHAPSHYTTCPCTGGVSLFREPAAGWSGTLIAAPVGLGRDRDRSEHRAGARRADNVRRRRAHPRAELRERSRDLQPPQLDRGDNLRQRPPSLREQTLTGLAHTNPRLTFTLIAGTNAAPVSSLTVTLPPGLSFTHQPKRLPAGLRLTGGRLRNATIKHARLIVTLWQPTNRLHIAIGAPALAETTTLASQVATVDRYNYAKSHHHKQRIRLEITVRATDATARSTELLAKFTAT